MFLLSLVNTLKSRHIGSLFPDDISKCIFLNENVWISIKMSLKFGPKGPKWQCSDNGLAPAEPLCELIPLGPFTNMDLL